MDFKINILPLIFIIYQVHTQSVPCSGDCQCPSSSSGEPCILNCDGVDKCKDGTLKCRSGDVCQVNCNGDNSCEGNSFIDGSGATDVIVNCYGDNACKGNTVINCGIASCHISCEQETSCKDTKVNAKFATSLKCSGNCNIGLIPAPFAMPTSHPTKAPTFAPTKNPTFIPTKNPTISPTNIPSLDPSIDPTIDPTSDPTIDPTNNPTIDPTADPTWNPTNDPTIDPTNDPTIDPSNDPTIDPTKYPSKYPTLITLNPSLNPTRNPIQILLSLNAMETTRWKQSESAERVHIRNEKMIISQKSNDSLLKFHVLIIFVVFVSIGSILCCVGICVYYTTKKQKFIEEISIDIEKEKRILSMNVMSENSINYTPKTTTITTTRSTISIDNNPENLTIPQIKSLRYGTNTNSIFQENVNNINMEPENDPDVDDIINTANDTLDNMIDNEPSISSSSSSSSSLSLSSCSTSSCSLSSNNNNNNNDDEKQLNEGHLTQDIDYKNSAFYAYAQAQAVCNIGLQSKKENISKDIDTPYLIEKKHIKNNLSLESLASLPPEK